MAVSGRSVLYRSAIHHMSLIAVGDYPFTRAPGVEMLLESMDSSTQDMFSHEEIEDLYHRNAERLFDRAEVGKL